MLADWNGLMVWGLAEAGGYLGRRDWVDLAAAPSPRWSSGCGRRGRPRPQLARGPPAGARLPRRLRADVPRRRGPLRPDRRRAYLDQARAWLARADAEFLDPETGAYFQNTPEAGLIVRPRNAHDGPYPPATARWPWSRPSSGT
jgi:uncharacterized protein YyaL (SSP411 family)